MIVKPSADPVSGKRRRGAGLTSATTILALVTGCAADVELAVGDVSFGRSDLLGLSESNLAQLVALTAIGIATARGEEDRLGEPILARQAEDFRIQRLREALILEDVGIDDDQLQTLYRRDPELELVVRHLVILSERGRPTEERDAARSRATEALGHARSGVPFDELAATYSEEPGAAERGGRLAPGREGTWVSEFWEAAVSLDPGTTSGVIETEYGFHVLKLDEKRPVPFEEGRARFTARLAGEIRGGEPDPPPDEVALRAALLAQADERALMLPPADSARLAAAWTARVQAWATTLGFAQRLSADEIAPRALAALGRTDQAARLAREAIDPWAEELATPYAVRRREP